MKLKKYDKIEIEWVDAVQGDKSETEKLDLARTQHVGYFLEKNKEFFAMAYGLTMDDDTQYKYKDVIRIPTNNVKKIRRLR